jgi:hypothetical protein
MPDLLRGALFGAVSIDSANGHKNVKDIQLLENKIDDSIGVVVGIGLRQEIRAFEAG